MAKTDKNSLIFKGESYFRRLIWFDVWINDLSIRNDLNTADKCIDKMSSGVIVKDAICLIICKERNIEKL